MIIEKPLTDHELWMAITKQLAITVTVYVDLDEIVGLDLEGFLNLLCDKVGSRYFSDFTYEVSGVVNGTLLIEISGFIADDPQVDEWTIDQCKAFYARCGRDPNNCVPDGPELEWWRDLVLKSVNEYFKPQN